MFPGVEASPRSRFITVYGRMPVREALADDRLSIDKVVIAHGSRGPAIDELLTAAKARGVRVDWASAQRVTRISRNGRHDQGVVADVTAPGLAELDDWLDSRRAGGGRLIVLDGLTNPSNVGMIIRAVTAAGMAGTVVPRFGNAEIGPLVVKASAGTAFRATILRASTVEAALDLLVEAGFAVYGLRAGAPVSLYDTAVEERAAFVFGNETDGVSPGAANRVAGWLSLPLAGGVESLNVATAAAVVAYELARRALSPRD
jgi:23S rRNA (guanosine2251-2'-O)-methyltransferase